MSHPSVCSSMWRSRQSPLWIQRWPRVLCDLEEEWDIFRWPFRLMRDRETKCPTGLCNESLEGVQGPYMIYKECEGVTMSIIYRHSSNRLQLNISDKLCISGHIILNKIERFYEKNVDINRLY